MNTSSIMWLSVSTDEEAETLRRQILLTIQRLDSTVDFSVAVVSEVAVIDSAKMTCEEKYKE